MDNVNRPIFFWLVALLLVPSFAWAQAGPTAPVDVVFMTSLGEIDVQLDPAHAPVTTANFLAYVDKKFYDGTIFHRVIRGFVAQGGGFTPGMVAKPPLFPPIKNESDNGLNHYFGTIAMARTADLNSATSQFFFVLGDHLELDANTHGPGYAVFGKITKGIDVLFKIQDVPTATVGQNEDVPVTPVLLISVTRAK